MRKSILFLGLCCLFMLLSLGCSSSQEEDTIAASGMTVTDSLGREILVPQNPERIISLSPATTEILFALGLGDKVVGDTEYCDYPEEAKTKDKVGGFENPNLELIVAKEPDLVFTAAGIQEEIIQKLEASHIAVVCLDAETIDQVMSNISLTGEITGMSKKAGEIVKDMEERVKAVQEKIKDKPRPVVFFEVWDDPLMTAGPGSFIDSLIQMAGGQNAAADLKGKFADYSTEKLLEVNPDIYIMNNHAHKPEDLKTRTGFDRLKAVQNDRVFTIEDDLVTLPGPRIIQGLEEMARIIHPEIFPK